MFIEAKDDGHGGDNWSYRSSVKSSSPTNQHAVLFLQAGCPSCRPTNSVKALKGKISHSMDLLTQSSPGGLPTLSLTTNSSWLPWGRFAMLLISPLMPVTHGIEWLTGRKVLNWPWIIEWKGVEKPRVFRTSGAQEPWVCTVLVCPRHPTGRWAVNNYAVIFILQQQPWLSW